MTYISPIMPPLYVGRALDLPPLTAQAAFDAHRQSLAGPSTQDSWAIETAFGELRIFGSGVTSRSGPADALRRARGLLRRRGEPWAYPIVDVEVEVMPWSADRCEIGIRPGHRRVPTAESRRRRRYLGLAVEAAERLACALERQVQDWLLAQLPQPGEEDVARIA